MTVKVLVVDDSAVVRGLISKALAEDSRIHVVATAHNGKVAVDMALRHQPDVIILDIEMPIMDGIAALPELVKVSPGSKIVMASSLTQYNAEASIKAMTLGAADYIGKPSSKEPGALEHFYGELLAKVRALGHLTSEVKSTIENKPHPIQEKPAASRYSALLPIGQHKVRALAIASSTGGPQALMEIVSGMQGSLQHLPIFITQHMPASFTAILAEHLARVGKRPCAEAKDGEQVLPGRIYLAPGNYHMLAEFSGNDVLLRLTQDPPENFCRPAADPMLRSLSKIYGSGLVVLVLTGMGQDGMLGCKQVVAAGGSVVAQDEASCVVYGMPKAVADAGLCTNILPLQQIPAYLVQQIDGKR